VTTPEVQHYKPETAKRFLALAGANDSAAYRMLAEKGLPTPRLERWKYTNLPAFLPEKLTPAAARLEIRSGQNLIERKAALNLAFLPVRTDMPYDRMLADLGHIFAGEGVFIDLKAGEAPQEPVELLWTGAEGALSTPVLSVRLGENAALTLIEDHRGLKEDGGAYWKNQLLRIELAPGARLRHYRILEDSARAVHSLTADITVARSAAYETFSCLSGGAMVHNDVRAVLQGSESICDISGVMLLRDKQHADNTILIEHAAPGCQSNQFFRSVLDDRAHGVFQGKIHVHREGQQTDGYQLANTLLLSEGAEMDTKPELEIYADDVKCSHGATTGQIDRDALFYLRARGISEEEARGLLIGAFINEAIDKVADAATRERFAQIAENWLRKAGPK
jgi:Fe-S cluster assembly protein SufD